jgi:hypothetical protein
MIHNHTTLFSVRQISSYFSDIPRHLWLFPISFAFKVHRMGRFPPYVWKHSHSLYHRKRHRSTHLTLSHCMMVAHEANDMTNVVHGYELTGWAVVHGRWSNINHGSYKELWLLGHLNPLLQPAPSKPFEAPYLSQPSPNDPPMLWALATLLHGCDSLLDHVNATCFNKTMPYSNQNLRGIFYFLFFVCS